MNKDENDKGREANGEGIEIPPPMQDELDSLSLILRGSRFLATVLKPLVWFGFGGEKLRSLSNKLGDRQVENQLKELTRLPLEFHQTFSKHGWLYSDSTNVETAKKALVLYHSGRVEEAEELLVQEFDGENLEPKITRLSQLNEFRTRRSQLREAQALSVQGRYLASIPLLFIIADGVGADAFEKSVFAEGANLQELNSLSGHPNALPKLITAIAKTRRKTTKDQILFPFRNGIMHGRDLGYGNRFVNAKCWSLLGNIADIIQSRRMERPERAEPTPQWREALKSFEQTESDRRRIQAWVPRTVDLDQTAFSRNSEANWDPSEPEGVLKAFLQAWMASNYGNMAQMTVDHRSLSVKQRAGKLRALLKDWKLIGAEFAESVDVAPSATEIKANLRFGLQEQDYAVSHKFCLECEKEGGGIAVHGEDDVYWRIREDYLVQYWGPPF